MRVAMLGPLAVTHRDAEIRISGARLRALLIRLAVDAGKLVATESLVDAVWPERRPTDQANALQSLVSRLRRVVPATIDSAPGGYLLGIDPGDVDVIRFERLAVRGRDLMRRGEPGAAIEALGSALELWRGDALSDVVGVPFAVAVATRLDAEWLRVAEDYASARLAASADPADVVAELEGLVAAHPLHERLRALHVRALHRAGRTAEALAAYEDARRRLVEELGSDPGPDLREAHLAALADDATPLAGPRGNVRVEVTELIGRSEELALVLAKLRDERLVTLTGPGGVGKTRLAEAAGSELSGRVADGVWVVELAPLRDPAQVTPTVVASLGLRDHNAALGGAHPDPTARIVEAIAGQRTFLVLDNCEHVIQDAAALASALLARCPDLRILVTSREPLGIVGESLVEVAPLGLPGSGADAALESAAVRLFVRRAEAVQPSFAVGDDIASVAQICRRLDGLPLALELAAARVRTLSTGEIRRRLDSRFELLSRGSRTSPDRHRTLAAAVAWSWSLLTDEEREFARRLGVFPSTFDLDAAEAVTSSSRTLDLLAALVDKSLLQRLPGPDSRFRMLETIRAYASRELVEAGESDAVQARHRWYVLDLAERAEPHLRGTEQGRWLARLRDERENLNTALQTARDANDAHTSVRLAAALGWFWTIDSDHADAVERLRSALDVTDPGRAAPSPPARGTAAAYLLFNAMLSGTRIDDRGTVRDWAGDPATRGDHPAVAQIERLLWLALAGGSGDDSAIPDRLEPSEPWGRGFAYFVTAMVEGTSGGVGASIGGLELAAEAFGEAGDRWGRALSLTILAMGSTTLGDVRAAGALEESIRLRRELDPNDAAAEQRAWLAQLHAWTGDVDRARAELEALVSPDSAIPARYAGLAHIVLGDLARHQGNRVEAHRHYEAASAAGEHAVDFMYEVTLLTARAHLAVARGETTLARDYVGRALALAIDSRDAPLASLVGVGAARLRVGDAPATAAELLGVAHGLRGGPDTLSPDAVDLSHSLRTALDDRAYTAAYECGRVRDRSSALDLIGDQVRRR